MLDPNPDAPDPRDWKNTAGYMAWDEGEDEPVVKNSYTMTYERSTMVDAEIDPENTKFSSVKSEPVGSIVRFSDSTGNTMLMQNGIYKGYKESFTCARFNSLAGADVTSSDDDWNSVFQQAGASGGQGYLQVNAVTEDQIPMPVKLTMEHGLSLIHI